MVVGMETFFKREVRINMTNIPSVSKKLMMTNMTDK
jgi:hypothetical protein